MKKIIVAVCCMLALAVAVQAQDTTKKQDTGKKKRELTAEQQTLQKEMTAKYDTNKDGKLDKDERAKISADDKAKMDKAGLSGGKKKEKKAE